MSIHPTKKVYQQVEKVLITQLNLQTSGDLQYNSSRYSGSKIQSEIHFKKRHKELLFHFKIEIFLLYANLPLYQISVIHLR